MLENVGEKPYNRGDTMLGKNWIRLHLVIREVLWRRSGLRLSAAHHYACKACCLKNHNEIYSSKNNMDLQCLYTGCCIIAVRKAIGGAFCYHVC